MYDLNAYRERCSELCLSEDKLQEVIAMTEQTKKNSVRRPLRVGLIAAALCAKEGIQPKDLPAGEVQQVLTAYGAQLWDQE